jgi:hypothetical protein
MKKSNRLYRVITALMAAAFSLACVADSDGAAPRLIATVGPGPTITLKTPRGAKVTRLRAGTYTFVVRDRSRFHNFHLIDGDPLVPDKRTGAAFVGGANWTIKLRQGLYRYVCDRHRSTMKGSFSVR